MNRQISVFALLVFSICSFAQNGDVEQSFKTGEDLFNKQNTWRHFRIWRMPLIKATTKHNS